MKSKLIVCFFALLTGVALALPVFVVHHPEKNNEPVSLYVLQIGVFESYENALQKQKEFPTSIIYNDSNFYRVLIGASTSLESLDKVKKILDEKNIYYYEKEITDVFLEKEIVSSYNLLLEQANEKESILLLNQKILETMVNI